MELVTIQEAAKSGQRLSKGLAFGRNLPAVKVSTLSTAGSTILRGIFCGWFVVLDLGNLEI